MDKTAKKLKQKRRAVRQAIKNAEEERILKNFDEIAKKRGIKKFDRKKALQSIYMQMKYLLENYPNLKEQRERLLYGSPAPADGLPKGNNIGNPTEQKALVLCTIDGQIRGN